jgi:DNA-binding XRE family transcriptional regulator
MVQPLNRWETKYDENLYEYDLHTVLQPPSRSIALPTDNSLEPVVAMAGINPLPGDQLDLAHQGHPGMKLVEEILTANYQAQLAEFLRDRSVLLNLVTNQLFQHLLKIYRHKVETLIQTDGIDAIDISLPHFKLVTHRSQKHQTLELVFDDQQIKNYLRKSLADFFNHTQFWHELAKTIGVNLVLQTIARLETKLGTQTFDTLPPESLVRSVKQELASLDASVLLEQLNFFVQVYVHDITRNIIQGFHLPTCSLQEIEKLLGLRQRPVASSHTSLSLDPVILMPTAIPIASSIRAQLRPDLWQQNDAALAVFRYQSKTNPNNYIEHYITNLGDVALLPWEAAEQIINKFGFDTVKLQLIFAARAMEEQEPWNSTFTLKATDIIRYLGWDRNHSTSLPEKRNAVASTAHALSCLLVKSVWVEGRGKRTVDASTPIGRMWDVLIDPHGQIDWVTGKIERPDEVYITVSPGLWTKHFLNRAGSKAKEALYQFGYLAKDILRIDPYHNEIALRLAIQLTLDARVRVRNQNPYDYRVLSLLEDVLPRTEIDKALLDKHKARDLKSRWNNALKLLMNLGWQIEFDPVTYPDWLQPSSMAAKPDDWRKIKVIERLLQAKLTIKPPHPIPSLLAKITEPKVPRRLESAPRNELIGAQLREGREKLGWSRKQLGGFLNVSADYIGKLERGDRMIPTELEPRLRRLLHL